MVNKNAEKLYRDVKKYPVMLYIGKSITNDEVLLLKDLGWSGVITSRTDDAFSDLWSREEIRLRDILPNSDTNVTAIIDEKDLLPIVRLFGIDGEEYISEDDIYSADDYAESMFQKASSCLDSVHKLVVAGYDSQADGELNFKSLIKSLTNAPNCSIQFWGCCVNNNEKVFRGFCGRKRHLIEPASLPGSLCEYIDYLEEANEDEVVEDVFFCDGKEIQYNKRAFGRQSGLYTLLTANTISGFKPVGEEMIKNSYLSFLDKTPVDGPQWYGYQADNCFYVKRNYEDKLYKLTTQMLRGHLDGYDRNIAVLQGPSGSSKSMVLGAVAYRIFEEKQYPVVYINKSDSELFAEGSADYDVLDSFLQKVEEKTNGTKRTLIIWDCSTYKSGESSAIKVMNYLRNNGRRFVMLCSSYERKTSEDKYYKFGPKGTKKDAKKDTAEFSARGVCYCVDSDPKINKTEKDQLWESFYRFSGLRRSELDRLKKELEDKQEDNIHYIFYRLFELIRPRIEAGLSREEDEVVLWVAQEISGLLGQSCVKENLDIDSLSPLQRALLKSGQITEEECLKRNRKDGTEKTDIEEVFITIAMFSKLRIPVPYQIVLNSLRLGDISYDVQGKIIDILSELSLLYYHRTDFGYCFSYRNPFEAEIFLKNKDSGGEREFEILRDVLDYYKLNLENKELRDMILEYLRLMGPNSNIALAVEDSREYFKNHMSDIVDDLSEIVEIWDEITDLEIVTSLVWTYLTFTREYYKRKLNYESGNLNLNDLQNGIDDLQYAIDIAAEVRDEIERHKSDAHYDRVSHIFEDNRGITVEYTLISTEIQRYVEEYKKYCESNSILPDDKYVNVGLDYKEVYDCLNGIIPEAPTNAYIYNALFKCFEKTYESWSETDRLNNLVMILRIISECNIMEIVNSGSDGNKEFENHIQEIYRYVSGHVFSIDEIIRRDNGELVVSELPATEQHHFSLYDNWMANKNPVGITFVCYKELQKCKAFDTSDDSVDLDVKIAACTKVVNFMYRYNNNFDAVKTDPQSLALLIKATWMYYNRIPLSAYTDRKLTKLTHDNWKDILNLCRIYDSKYHTSTYKFRSKIIVLLYAIAEIQVNNDLMKAVTILRTLEKSSFTSDTRIYTPYMLCDENGITRKFSGDISYINPRKQHIGRIKLHATNLTDGIHFNANNICISAKELELGNRVSGLEIGVGYMGLSLYTEKGREYRGDFVE